MAARRESRRPAWFKVVVAGTILAVLWAWTASASAAVGQVTLVGGSLWSFSGVACAPSSTSCEAVGTDSTFNQPVLVPINNGHVGSPSDPSLGHGALLRGIACATSSTCYAVGGIGQSGPINRVPLVLPIVFGGAGVPMTEPNIEAEFNSVACASSTSCVAVGTNLTTNDFGGIVAPIVNGTLGQVTLVPQTFTLDGVACQTSTSCTAVGRNLTGKGIVLPIPDVASMAIGTPAAIDGTGRLEGVACPTSTSCLAVGNDAGNMTGVVVTFVYGGTDRVEQVADTTELTGVACLNPSSCEASGNQTTDQFGNTIGVVVAIANGDAGPTTAVPGTVSMAGVACSPPAACYAVGDFLTDTGSEGAVVTITGSVATTTDLASSANPAAYGQDTTFAATVSPSSGPGTPTGAVTFKDGTTTLGTATLNGGSASLTTSALTVGAHTISASYSGDGGFDASSATLTETVDKAATQLTSAPASKTTRTFSATLTRTDDGAAISGQNIVFSVPHAANLGATMDTVCSATTGSNGTATCIGTVTQGDRLWDHTYSATYGGNASYLMSTATARFS